MKITKERLRQIIKEELTMGNVESSGHQLQELREVKEILIDNRKALEAREHWDAIMHINRSIEALEEVMSVLTQETRT